MKFAKITIDEYVKIHKETNPKEDTKYLKQSLLACLKDYKNGVKCECGHDIWVIGSAIVGNRCFTCITGESAPSGDYEIEGALEKRSRGKRRSFLDEY